MVRSGNWGTPKWCGVAVSGAEWEMGGQIEGLAGVRQGELRESGSGEGQDVVENPGDRLWVVGEAAQEQTVHVLADITQ